jgi:hypothetical protein
MPRLSRRGYLLFPLDSSDLDILPQQTSIEKFTDIHLTASLNHYRMLTTKYNIGRSLRRLGKAEDLGGVGRIQGDR